MDRDPGTTERVSIVVLNWNGWRDTLACLASLRGLDYPNVEIVVVDNGSTDGSEERIRSLAPDVAVLQSGANLGFAGGCNVGIRHALNHGAAYVWLLNNDTIVAPGSLSAMVRAARRSPAIGVVGSPLYYASDPTKLQVWGGGRLIAWLGITWQHKRAVREPIDHVVGASMLIRRETLETTGCLDDTFFFYLEDTDFCLRARQRGWTLAVAPESTILHKVGGTVNEGGPARSERADLYYARGTGIFVGKHAGAFTPLAVPIRLALILGTRLRRRQWERIVPAMRQFLEGFRHGARHNAPGSLGPGR